MQVVVDNAATGKALLAPGVLDRRTTICPLDKARHPGPILSPRELSHMCTAIPAHATPPRISRPWYTWVFPGALVSSEMLPLDAALKHVTGWPHYDDDYSRNHTADDGKTGSKWTSVAHHHVLVC